MTDGLTWQQIATRAEARVLQAFTCTTEFPKTQGGRNLPHPRPWEWEAQRHLRQLSQLLKAGDLAVVARAEADIVGCAHLRFSTDRDVMEAFHAAAGVAQAARHLDGHLADELLAYARAIAIARASELNCSRLVLTGKIHTRNRASQRMVDRAGWEPEGVPASDYQMWAVIISVDGTSLDLR